MAIDLEDVDYSDLEQKFASTYNSPLDSVVILDGAPIVGPDRSEKLISAIIKSTLKETGIKLSRDAFELPLSEDGQSKGFMFVSLGSVSEAQVFAKSMHKLPFDKRHTFSVVPFSEVDRYDGLEDEWKEPEIKEYEAREHFRDWLADPAGRDQMVLYRQEETAVMWNSKSGPNEVAHQRTRWTDAYTQWSPLGTLLATIHAPGVALWGGPSFTRLNRFAHPEVKLIDFSPFERYMVTWSSRPIEISLDQRGPKSPFTDEDEGNQIAVWDVFTGALLRTFPMVGDAAPGGVEKRITWPTFKWSPDEKYLARVTPGQQISVYEAPSMGLLGKKSIKIEGVVDFEWQPMSEKEREAMEGANNAGETADGKKQVVARENMMAFWTPEVQNQPARVTLMTLPSRTTIRSKNLFNVHDCKIHWQTNGDFLCVKVDRHTKTKKTQYCNLELFRLRDKDCPVQVIEIKDAVTAFAWEPKGERFVLITTNDPNHAMGVPGALLQTSVSFYGFDVRKGDFLLLKTFEKKTSNSVFWSPKGRHVLIATLGSNSKFDIEFWDMDLDKEGVDEKDQAGQGIKMITNIEHFGMTDVEWDPSGRYVATSASTWMSSMEPGYVVWDFKGVEIKSEKVDKFKQLLWRPRPPTLLSKDDQKRIRKNLRDFSRQFEDQDQLDELNVSEELIALRRRNIEEWNSWRKQSREGIEALRIKLGKKVKNSITRMEEASKADEEVEEIVEEVISETIEIIA